MPAGFLKINRDAWCPASFRSLVVTHNVAPSDDKAGLSTSARRLNATRKDATQSRATGYAPRASEMPGFISSLSVETPLPSPSPRPTFDGGLPSETTRVAPPKGWFSFLKIAPSPQEDAASLARRMQASLSAETAQRAQSLGRTQKAKRAFTAIGAACLVGAFVALPILAGTAGATLPLVFFGLIAGGLVSLVSGASLTHKLQLQFAAHKVAREALDAAEQEIADNLLAQMSGSPAIPASPSTTSGEASRPQTPRNFQVAWQAHLSRPDRQSRQLLVDVSRRLEPRHAPTARSSWASSLVGAAIGTNRLGLSRLGEHSITAAAMTAFLAPQTLQVFLLGCVVFWLGLHKKLFKD